MEDSIEWMEALKGFGTLKMEDIGIIPLLAVMTVSLLCSMFIAYLYRIFFRKRSTGTRIDRAFPLLGLSVTAIFITIQFSLPLSLGLLGALSIVRFRTPIKEPEEIGFIMLVIATALCCGTFNMIFLVMILFLALIALSIQQMKFLQQNLNSGDGVLVITIPGSASPSIKQDILTILPNRISQGKLGSIVKNDEEVNVSYTFSNLQTDELCAIDHEICKDRPGVSCSIVMNRPGDF